MKRILAIVLTCVMLLSVLPTVAFAEETAKIKVSANVSKTVNAGDTVEFTVSLGAVKELTTLEFVLDIPSGLTYVAGSGATVNGLAGKLNMAAADFNENELKFAGYGSGSNPYTGTSDLVLMTFKCNVAGDAATSLDVSVKDMAASVGVSFTPISCVAEKATIRVNKPATGISLDKTSISLSMAGTKTATLTATVEPDNTTDTVTWSVSPAGVVSLSATTGKDITVTALKVGKATITAKAGNKTATCIVEVSACNHVQGAKHEFQDSTCQVVGNKEYWDCENNCGAVYVDGNWTTDKNATVIAKKDHTEGTPATCTTPAICSVCKQEYGTALGHQLKKVAGTPATCTTDGVKDYWECDRCHEKFLDAKGLTPATAENVKIPAPGHKMVKTEAKAATCTATGNIEYYTCSVCKKLFTNEAGTTETTLEAVTIPMVAHTASNKYVAGATQHWTFCTVCGEVLTKVDHTYVNGKCECGATNKDAAVDANHKDHKAGGNNYFNETKHWADCSDPNCAGHVGEANHSLTTKSTIVVNGKKYEVKTCDCGYVTRVEVKNNTTGTTIGTNPNAKNPYEKNDTTKKDDGKKVESGKTFDAGIALYVGLSVLSVTGGALVIGKKKEF